MEHRLTAGASRVLLLAARLAAWEQTTEILPRHLLWALWLDETRGAEILSQCGFEAVQFPTPAPPEELPEYSPAELPPPSDTLTLAVMTARGIVALVGRQAEVGSEHLLAGLAEVESPVSVFLRKNGLTVEVLRERLSEQSGLETGSLAVDFSLRPADQPLIAQVETLRVLDAAANRCREGLRALEDFTRFTLDDAHLSGLLKNFRHQLTQTLRPLDASALLAARETQQDVGTRLTTGAEQLRSTLRDVALANFKRVQEALRTLEEFGKIISPELGQDVERLRYQSYTLEKALFSTLQNRDRLRDCRLYLLASEELCDHGSGPAIRGGLLGGVQLVQVREKKLRDRELLAHARRVREWTRELGALMIINDRPDLAVLSQADGVHVGQEELSVKEARQIVGPDRLIGVSTHTIEQARQAVLDGADYLGVGPVFPSTTKQFTEFAGLEFVRQVATEITLPWFAIGGIAAVNLPEVMSAGATRIAVSGSICGQANPQQAAAELLRLLTHVSAQ